MRIQNQLDVVVEEILATDGVSGVWIDHRNGARITVGLTAAGEASAVAPLLDGLDVSYIDQATSCSALLADQAKLTEIVAAEALQVMSGIDLKLNRIEVVTTDRDVDRVRTVIDQLDSTSRIDVSVGPMAGLDAARSDAR